MRLEQVRISETLQAIVRIGVVFLDDVKNGPPDPALDLELEEICEEYRRLSAERKPTEIEAVARTRKLYRRVGIDPTRDRPSSERLLRRVLKKQPLPKVNKLVDCINMASLKLQCPLGLYDWGSIVPPVTFRVGLPGEELRVISERSMSLEGKLVCADEEGPFGNPSHGSHRTRVGPDTSRAMAACWSPAEHPRSYIDSVLDEIARAAGEYCGARVAGRRIF